MDNLHRYQSYRLRRRLSLFERGKRLLAVAGVILVLIILGKALRGSPEKDQATTNVPPLAQSSANGNVNASVTTAIPPTISSVTTAACPGVVSQIGDKKRIALTFNAGTGVGSIERIRDLLKETNAAGTFFASGEWIEKNGALAKSLSEGGFGIYNYTYDRPHPAQLSKEDLTAQLQKAEQIIQTTVGKNPRPFFRPPFGEFSDDIVAAAKAAGYCVIHWTVDALDWQEGQTVAGSKERVLEKARPGAIVLMNVGSDIVVELIPALVAELRSQGYELVGLETLFQT